MTRRAGLTLVEVLVAIFVMGIGMIALLTLFPIGVLQMAQAIRQDRCLRAAQAADTISVLPLGYDGPVPATANPTSLRYDYTMSHNPALVGPLAPTFGLDQSYFTNCTNNPKGEADPYGPSYAIMVDPHGFLATQGLGPNIRPWVGGQRAQYGANAGLIRRPVFFANGIGPNAVANIKRWFSLPDDLVFDNDPYVALPSTVGTPKIAGVTANGNTIMRDTPFSWTYVLQRPRTGDTAVVNCTIVVFENRTLLMANLGSQQQLQGSEIAYPAGAATFNLTNNTITLTAPAQPNVSPGDWLYDATIIWPAGVYKSPEVMSAFYRVVAVDEIGANTYRYEVQQPLRPMARDPQRNQHANTIIVMAGVAEVFERGPVRVP